MSYVPADKGQLDHARVTALRALDVLDSPVEQSYEDLVSLASLICQTPIALISLVDQDRQWFKAKVGLDTCETHRDLAFCSFAIQNPDELLVVNDASTDARFRDHPLVSGEPYIRFYAGAPIVGELGYAFGTLCVVDHVSRDLSSSQKSSLRALAKQAAKLLDFRAESAANKRHMIALERSERRFRLIAENLPAAVMHHDQSGRLTYANARAEQIFNRCYQAMAGLSLRQLWQSDCNENLSTYISAALCGNRVSFEGTFQGNDCCLHYRSDLIPDRDSSGVLQGFYAVTFDITELKVSQLRLEALANLDALTGLPNRRQFEYFLTQSMERARRTQTNLALMFVDIDRFKYINDSLGHAAGDEVIRIFGERLKRGVRTTDFVARLGGDEFVIVLERIRDSAQLAQIASSIADAIRAEMVAGDSAVRVTASIGVASFCGADISDTQLLELADRALYMSKQAGRDRFSYV